MLRAQEHPTFKFALDTQFENKLTEPWKCILFNDDFHSFDEVITQVIRATGYSEIEAASITLEAHHEGQAVVYTGEAEKCFQISTVLEKIYLLTEVRG